MIETLNAYDKAIESSQRLSHTLKIYPKVFQKSEFHKYHKFFDKALFSSLNLMDLIIGLKFLDLSKGIGNNVESNYFARIVALTSHEILNELNALIGKDIREELIHSIGIEKISELDAIIKEMNILKKKHLSKLKKLRNNVIGHKLAKGYEQAEMIANIDVLGIYNIGDAIFKVQMKLIGNFTYIIAMLK